MSKLSYLAVALGLAVAGCDKNDTRDNAENAAEEVREQTGDLQDEAKDLKEVAQDQAEDLDVREVDPSVGRNRITETTNEVGDVTADRAEIAKDTAEDISDESKEMANQSIETRDAQKEFEYQRLVRVQTLRAVHGIAASQPMLINAIASSFAMNDGDRARINEKVQLMQMRLDESANLIQRLESVDANNWEPRDRDVSSAMSRLEDAREDAWDALDDASHLDTSMR